MPERRPSPEELQARAAARCARFRPPPRVELPRLSRFDLLELVQSGSGEFDALEAGLKMASRVVGAIDLAIAEGLRALTVGTRLLELGLRLDDYAREVLDLEPRTVMKRVRLAKQLRTRPLLREALGTGRVSLRAAEVVAPVARGEAEAAWVERAAAETVRALEERVRAARTPAGEVDEEWGRFTAGADDADLAVIDQGLEVAGQLLPGSERFQQLEAMAQEYLGGHPEAVPEGDPPPGAELRWTGRRESALAQEKARREAETERWATLEPVPRWGDPDLRWEEVTTADELDATLRQLVQHRDGWDALVSWAACELKGHCAVQLMGFASFRHYVEERLGLPPRAVEQRARLEQRIRRSPALAEARAAGVSYERLRALANLPEQAVRAWIPRAKAMTVIALRRELEEGEARQMRAARRFAAAVPERVAALLASAFRAVRAQAGSQLPSGRCLAIVALHFLDTHGAPARPRTPSQKVRARDGWRCTVPGCSHTCDHSHHIEFLSHGGARLDPANQTALCAFHHTCIHDGYMALVGEAPEALRFERRGSPWTGRP